MDLWALFLGNWSPRSPPPCARKHVSLCFLTLSWLLNFFLYHCLSYDCAQTAIKPTILGRKGRKTDKTVIQKQAGKWSHVAVTLWVGCTVVSEAEAASWAPGEWMSPWGERVLESIPALGETQSPDGAPCPRSTRALPWAGALLCAWGCARASGGSKGRSWCLPPGISKGEMPTWKDWSLYF